MRLIDQNTPIPSLPRMHIDNRSVYIVHCVFLDPRLDLLFRREGQHLGQGGWRRDEGCAEVDVVWG